MQDPSDDLIVRVMLTEPTIAKLTPATVAEALEGFPISPKREIPWIARAVQGALYTSLGWSDGSPERQSNAQTRDELAKLAGRTSTLWLALADRSSAADDALWRFAFDHWDGQGGTEIDGMILGEPEFYRQISDAITRLDSLAAILRRASQAVEVQKPNWRRAELREQRIFRAQCLSPIFQTAFDLEPTVNSWPGASSQGPWPDFYQRVVALAFGERATPDLEGVLDEARRRDKQARVEFAAGVIPD